MKNILLINVCLRPNGKVKYIPIGLGYIATALKNDGIEFDLYDMDINNYDHNDFAEYLSDKQYDFFLLGCIVTGYKYVKEIAHVIKEKFPKSTIIVGNSVGSSISNILLSKTDVDIVICGEVDETVVELIHSLENGFDINNVAGIVFRDEGKLKRTHARRAIENLDNLTFLDYSLWDIERYIEYMRNGVGEPLPIPRDEIRPFPINTARGCPHKCTFCYHVFQDMKYRRRSWKNVMDEIEDIIQKYDINYVLFNDELTFSNKKTVREFIDEYNRRNMSFYWLGDCRGNLFNSDDDVQLLAELKKTGCYRLGYSLESANSDILKDMNKNVTAEQFSKQSKLLRDAGIPISTSLVFGFPQETPDTIRQTIDCCIENKIYPSAGFLLLFPGSKMYNFAIENGFINDEEEYLLNLGDRQDLRINLTKMSDNEFIGTVENELLRCNEELDMGLSKESLIKTQYYHSKNQST